jgi:hypothetical protein
MKIPDSEKKLNEKITADVTDPRDRGQAFDSAILNFGVSRKARG